MKGNAYALVLCCGLASACAVTTTPSTRDLSQVAQVDAGDTDGNLNIDAGITADAAPADGSQSDGLQTGPDGATCACPQGCTGGVCNATVSCTPGAQRCLADVVQVCNGVGSAWLFDQACAGGCGGGMCLGSCNAGDVRCNGSALETCGSTHTWSTSQTCTLGCRLDACVESDLVSHGSPLSLSGRHVYDHCVTIDLGGTLTVPAGQTLDIYADCLSLSKSSSVTLGSAASLFFHAASTIQIDGTVSGGAEVLLSAWTSFTSSGSISSTKATVRSDQITNTGSLGSASALYGISFSQTGTHTGVVSVMPPERIVSSTHPAGMYLNLNGDIDVAWDRPFPNPIGYYLSVGDAVPSPSNATLQTGESARILAEVLKPGINRVRLVSVNANSVIGTVAGDLQLTMNIRPPTVSSLSHPDEVWGGAADVQLAWVDPAGAPAGAFPGYYWAFDHNLDTVPGPAVGTFTTNKTLLLTGQANGQWYFHLVNIDRMGRTSPSVAHFPVRIGPQPAFGNMAGHITELGNSTPVVGARVSINGGAEVAFSGPTGDYTFTNRIPVSAAPYRVDVAAPGYVTQHSTVTVATTATQLADFQLAGGTAPTAYKLGWELPLSATAAVSPTLAVGPNGKYLWSELGAEHLALVDQAGQELMSETTLSEYYTNEQGTDVGFNGTRFWAIDTYACNQNGSLAPGQGWSCLRMRTWNPRGVAVSNWVPYAKDGQSGAPSGVWNGSSYGVMLVSYTAIYGKELTESIAFPSTQTATSMTLLSGGWGDTRQSAYTSAVWDGTAYAVLFAINNSASTGGVVEFARYGTNFAQLQAPVNVGSSQSNYVPSLVYDGNAYHAAYLQRDAGGKYSIQLRPIDHTGVLGTSIAVATNTVTLTPPSQAVAGSRLLVAYAKDGQGVLEVRSVVDSSLVFSQALGPMTNVRVAATAETGEAAVLYTNAGGTFLRAIRIYDGIN